MLTDTRFHLERTYVLDHVSKIIKKLNKKLKINVQLRYEQDWRNNNAQHTTWFIKKILSIKTQILLKQKTYFKQYLE